MPKVSQEEYDQVLRTIEENSCYRFKAGDTASGAFLIATDGQDHPVGDVFHLPWPRLKAFAKTLLEARPLVDHMLARNQPTGREEVPRGK